MSDVRWNLTYKDKVYEFDANHDLTAGKLRQMKGWFGTGYGQYANVLNMLIVGDADAWASAIWICLKKEGDPCPSNPTMIDFAVGDLMDNLEQLESPDEPEEGEEAPLADPSPSSVPTSTTSEESSSPS